MRIPNLYQNGKQADLGARSYVPDCGNEPNETPNWDYEHYTKDRQCPLSITWFGHITNRSTYKRGKPKEVEKENMRQQRRTHELFIQDMVNTTR